MLLSLFKLDCSSGFYNSYNFFPGCSLFHALNVIFMEKKSFEIVDMVKGKLVSGYLEPNCRGIHAKIAEPLGIISAMHGLEYSYANDFKPTHVDMVSNISSNPVEINISSLKPEWKVYVVSHRRNGYDASKFLNSYNNFLKEYHEKFPSNLIIKSANGSEFETLRKEADYVDSGLLYFSGPEDIKNISELNNYPIEYKVKI